MICIEVKSIISAEGGRHTVMSSRQTVRRSSSAMKRTMKTQPKTDLPTHTVIRSTGRVSTVLCEQIVSVSVDRIAGYIGQVSEQEQKNIDIALMISLQLDGNMKISKKYNETIKEQQEEIDHLKTEIEEMEKDRKELIEQVNQYAAANAEKNKKVEQSASQESMIRLETERDTFKQLYESLLTKVMAS